MNKSVVTLLSIIIGIPLLAVAFPDLGRSEPAFHDIPKEYVTFPTDSKFNFDNMKVNYPYFYQYRLDIKYLISCIANGKNKIMEDTTPFEDILAKATPIYDNKNIHYLGQTNTGQYVYQTNVHLHLSIYVSYPISYFDTKKEYILDLGESTLFTKISPEEYKIIAPQLEMQ